jgi:CHAD domain-containing protein
VTTLSPQRRGTRQVRKITRKRIDSALRVLSHENLSAESVHSARKALKKARAGLRMLRPGVKESAYRWANEALRDAGRPLSEARDAQVIGETLAAVLTRYGAPAHQLRVEPLRRTIARHRTVTHQSLLEKPAAIAHSRGLLREARARVAALSIDAHDWEVLGLGLERVYSRCKRAMINVDRSGSSGSPAAFHEWRKQVKYLRYELTILKPLWPALIDTLTEQAHRLTDYLGEDHDLTVLREMAVAHREDLGERACEALLALIERRQHQLRKKAIRLGSRLFEERPKRFVARLGDYWHRWRKDPLPV